VASVDLPEILTPAELAEFLRIPERTLKYWRVNTHTGPRAFRAGKYVRYLRADVLRWAELQQEAYPASAHRETGR
jgi:Helix-turn-helix domain